MITKSERESLLQVCRLRARVAKADAATRSATLKADFEAQLAKVYSFDEDAVWQAAREAAKEVARQANAEVTARCEQLGIPRWAQPAIGEPIWYGRGENASGKRREELRKVAYTRIDESEKHAKLAIDRKSVEAQTQLLADGLTTEDAKRWLEGLPTAEQLMPPVNMVEIRKQLRQRDEE